MPTKSFPHLFKPLSLDGLQLKNRITMAPLYLGYAGEGGKVSALILNHYRRMARSGAAVIVVENAAVAAGGMGSPRTLRCDHGRFFPGLRDLAGVIGQEKAVSALQINHAGRFAHVTAPLAQPGGHLIIWELLLHKDGAICVTMLELSGIPGRKNYSPNKKR